MVFDVKINFMRKTRWVLHGHRTLYPEGSLYDVVISREDIMIALPYSALNGLNVVATDIRNADI